MNKAFETIGRFFGWAPKPIDEPALYGSWGKPVPVSACGRVVHLAVNDTLTVTRPITVGEHEPVECWIRFTRQNELTFQIQSGGLLVPQMESIIAAFRGDPPPTTDEVTISEAAE